MSVLITGGAGYIGSHTCVELLNEGIDVVVADNLVNASMESLRRVEKISGKTFKYYILDICDEKSVDKLFDENKDITSVIHFAALKAVGESVEKPLEYYTNNIVNTLVLLNGMRRHHVKNLVFSSSATVYGDPASMPVDESFPTSATNPYGQTKLMIEQILTDVCRVGTDWNIALLRYFNPIGAHESGLIGEDPNGIPNNLVPYIAQAAAGKREYISVYGNDYATHDGTGVRDYIHVVDLARGHLSALNKIEKGGCGLLICNLGTGKGYSVLDVIHAYEKACHKVLPYRIVSRRAGDVGEVWAGTAKAKALLGWEARYDIDRMCEDSWRWQSMNPNGYSSSNEQEINQ